MNEITLALSVICYAAWAWVATWILTHQTRAKVGFALRASLVVIVIAGLVSVANLLVGGADAAVIRWVKVAIAPAASAIAMYRLCKLHWRRGADDIRSRG